MARIALIGDYRPQVVAHGAIPQALDLARKSTGRALEWEWIGTEALVDAPRQLADYTGVWCVPGSPYRNTDGALAAIRFAREKQRAFPLVPPTGQVITQQEIDDAFETD